MDALFSALYAIIGRLLPLEALAPEYMKRALLAVLIIPPLCAAMGVPLLQFRMAFFSDAVGHSAFTGVALGAVLAAWLHVGGAGADLLPTLGIFAFCLLVAYGITHVRGRSELSRDTIVGVFASASVALGIAVLGCMKLSRNIAGFLFVEALAVSEAELTGMAALAAVIGLYLYLTFNRLTLLGIEEGFAQTKGVPVRALEVTYALAVALVVAAAIRTVGMLLVTAMLVIPAATGRNLARGAAGAFWLSVGIGLACGIGGLFASYYLDIPLGAGIVLLSAACFALSLPLRRLRPRSR